MPLKSCIENEGFTLVQVLPLTCTSVTLRLCKCYFTCVKAPARIL